MCSWSDKESFHRRSMSAMCTTRTGTFRPAERAKPPCRTSGAGALSCTGELMYKSDGCVSTFGFVNSDAHQLGKQRLKYIYLPWRDREDAHILGLK